ncbi:DUF4180 domain-containing protein [Microterricola pindariensis]|uniref:DUF4180 domain-containing protein n=1 Tax=Microterricola pindariensis TaxID=478010 RepID=A0ABX5ATY5_9MICO|nr:DUF4180 domain-containing protein [Microterricola pindariensis]PPL15657.1 hypothetical protein GY24_13990 [Microterricola pindariensis]
MSENEQSQRITESGGLRVLHVDPAGPPIVSAEETSDLIGNAWVDNADVIALPVSRLDAEFFRLASGQAGAILQKVANYQLKLAIIGDIGAHLAASGALRDFVWESNRGEHIWFVDEASELEQRLEQRKAVLDAALAAQAARTAGAAG